MNWIEIIIEISSKYTDTVSELAQLVNPDSVYIEDYSQLEKDVMEIAHTDLIDNQLKNKAKNIAKIHIYLQNSKNIDSSIDFLNKKLNENHISNTITKKSISNTNEWETKWQEFYHPLKIGKNVIICPKWEKFDNKSDEIKVILNPGISFGTGKHETTQMCIEFLETLITPNCTVLDVGCGSGILSITSILLGAKSSLGVDIDPLAVKIAKENAQLNNIDESSFKFLCGNLTEKIHGKFDVICANIVSDIIIERSANITKFMHSENKYICSGIIAEREVEVINKLKQNNLIPQKIKRNKDWVSIYFKLKK